MRKQIFVGLIAEGATDNRFLYSIVNRTFEDVALNECTSDIDIYVFILKVSKKELSFPEFVVKSSHFGVANYGIMVLAVHTDADRETYEERFADKILPACQLLNKHSDDEYCKILLPIIPVRMIEAWMLADTELLKEEVGTDKSDHDLGIDKNPESIADPKACICEMIRIATEDLPRRRNRLTISDLYEIIGDKISLDSLKTLDSYRRFVAEVKNVYASLNYIR